MAKATIRLLIRCLMLWVVCFSVLGESSKKVVIISSNSHFGLVHRIEALLYAQPQIKPRLAHQVIDNERTDRLEKAVFEDAHFAVTVGTEALSATLQADVNIPILSILIREHAFHQLLEQYQNNPVHSPLSITALYLDQPITRQFDLIKTLIPRTDALPIGILLQSRSSPNPIYTYHIEVPEGIKVITAHTQAFANPSQALERLLEESRVLLALPDVSIYNAKSARGILLTAYHKRVPVIAYSRTFVNNGALAAVYCTPKQIAEQTTRIMISLLQQDLCELPDPLYPDDFSVAINYQVANTLGLFLPNEAQVQKIMQEKNGKIQNV